MVKIKFHVAYPNFFTCVIPTKDIKLKTFEGMVALISARESLLKKSLGIDGSFSFKQYKRSKSFQSLNFQDNSVIQGDSFLSLYVKEDFTDCVKDKNLLYIYKGRIYLRIPASTRKEVNPDILNLFFERIYLTAAATSTGKRFRSKDIGYPLNERYHFRSWLYRIGCVGDDYKHLRKVLMKPLRGDSGRSKIPSLS